jgi:hypothetical protein
LAHGVIAEIVKGRSGFDQGCPPADLRWIAWPRRVIIHHGLEGMMDTMLAYLGPLLTLAAGLLALAVTKEGKWTKPKGWGLLFPILVLAGSALALWQVRDKLKDAAEARAQAQAAANREAAGQRTMLGGFDFARPFETGSFYFDVETDEEGRPLGLDGFVGPFLSIGPGASGVLTINVRDGFYYEFRLVPAPGRRLQLINADGAGPGYVLEPSPAGGAFVRMGDAAGHRETSRWAGGPLRPGQWAAISEGDDLAYHLGIASAEPLRRIVSGLAGSATYGSLRLHLPEVTEDRRQAIAEAYRRIRPYFVFHAPLANAAANPDCVTRIRVPMEVRRADSGNADDLLLEFAAASEGFDTETCETAFIP